MKRFRLSLLAAGAVVLLVLVAAAIAFSSAFQTWAVRRALASRPDLAATVGRVDAGLRRVTVRDVRYVHDGAVLQVPAAEVGLAVLSAAFSEKVLVSQFVAKGWTLDLSTVGGRPGAPASQPVQGLGPADMPVATATAAGAALQAFSGIFDHLRLPVDLALDGVQLEGEVILPESRGRVKIAIAGGGIGAGREGKFDLAADGALSDPSVNRVTARGTLVGAMDTPRSFTHLAVKFDAEARGAQFPAGVRLTAGLTAARAAAGETYSATLVSQERQLAAVKADFPRDASRLTGTWRLDVRDVDIAPFALGHPLPAFTALGDGDFDADAAFSAVRVNGRLNGTAGRLETVKPELSAIGTVKIGAEFDLAQHGDTLSVQRLEASLSSVQPVLSVTALQPFDFNPRTGELRAGDPARELVGIALQGLPLAWVKPFLKDVDVSGADVRGELAATARGGGITLRSRAPLVVERVNVASGGKPLVRDVALSLSATADYTPTGWQVAVSELTARQGEVLVMTFEGKAGQLAGPGQALKAAGKTSANLAQLLRQPAAENILALSAGEAAIDFVASMGEKTELQAKVALKDLAATADDKPLALPAISANLRADVSAAGEIALNAPILIERDGRKSDVTAIGTIGPLKDKVRAVELQVTSAQLVLDDARILAAILPNAAKETPSAGAPKDAAPPWAGLSGSLALQLKRVIYSEAFEMTNVGGRVRIDAGTLKLETVQSGLGEGGRAALSGTVTFDPKAEQPYSLFADVSLRDFDPSPLFDPAEEQAAPVEGKFDVTSRLTGKAATFGSLAAAAGGDLQLTSKGGIFRGLPVNAATLAENTSKIASWLASAGTAIGALTGKKDYTDVANKSQAVAEVARALSAIAYDQLSFSITRDAALNTTLKDFSLISPELRLTGAGTATHHADATLLDDSLEMEFTLRARGRQGDLLKYLGALEPQTDDLGYAACTLPLKVGGTLGKPDTSELNGKLATLALEKSGVTEKASELFNRIIGNGGGK